MGLSLYQRSLHLAQLSDLQFLENLHCAKDTGVDDAGNSEGSAHNCADCGQEVVERRTLLVISDRNRVQVVPKQI